MLCKLFPVPSAGCHGDCPRAQRFAARDVAWGVANHIDLGRGELSSVFLLCACASKSAELVPVAVIVGKRAEFEEMPDAVVLEFKLRAAGDIPREKRQHDVWPRLQAFK